MLRWLRRLSCVCALLFCLQSGPVRAELRAGAARVDITDYSKGPVVGPMHARALAVSDGSQTLLIITLDVVAIGEIGPIGNDFLPALRERLRAEFGVQPHQVLVTASHCHGQVRGDTLALTLQAVRSALRSLVPVRVGVGVGHEDRVQHNRRIRLLDGARADERRAYALPPDGDVAAVGPIDPEIGVLRLDRADGTPLALVYNFACHPIQGVPGAANTADLTGFASELIEEELGGGAVALFLQGCAGDINPVDYKAWNRARDARVLGMMLGLSTLRAARSIVTKDDARLELRHEVIDLPRADWSGRIRHLEQVRDGLVERLQGTSLNLKSFLQLSYRHGLWPEYPSHYKHEYLHEKSVGRAELEAIDRAQRRELQAYLRNVRTMEELTRVVTNLRLLRKHQARYEQAKGAPVRAEVTAVRIGEFVLVTFPGEPCVEVGLRIKKASPFEHTFVAGYTNGYIYYAPTAEDLKNPRYAQEDCDCMLDPGWEAVYRGAVARMLEELDSD